MTRMCARVRERERGEGGKAGREGGSVRLCARIQRNRMRATRNRVRIAHIGPLVTASSADCLRRHVHETSRTHAHPRARTHSSTHASTRRIFLCAARKDGRTEAHRDAAAQEEKTISFPARPPLHPKP